MDTYDHEPPPPIDASTATARLHGHLHDILDPPRRHPDEPPLDVRDYLLDPPPTEAELERRDRRRRQVRLASIIAAGVIAIALLVPLPRRGDDPAVSTVAAADRAPLQGSGASAPVVVTERLPRRIDVPSGRTRERPAARPRNVARPIARPRPRPARATDVAVSVPSASSPPAVSGPTPSASPRPVDSAGALVPVL